MDKVVVVSLLFERKEIGGEAPMGKYVTRIRALGLTAYGSDHKESDAKAKRLFGTWVGIHRKSGTLEQALNRSGLSWNYEHDYSVSIGYEEGMEEVKVKILYEVQDA